MRDDLIKRLAAANPVPGDHGGAHVRARRSYGDRRLGLVAAAWGLATIATVLGVVFFAHSSWHRARNSPTGLAGPNFGGLHRWGSGEPTGATGSSGPSGSGGPSGSFGPTGPIVPTGPDAPPTAIALSDASGQLGAPVYLPDASPITPADTASATATAACPKRDDGSVTFGGGPVRHSDEPSAPSCDVVVSFPSLGLRARYSLRSYRDPLSLYQTDAASSPDDVELVYVGGAPALLIPDDTASFIQFAVDGTTVSLTGPFDDATLERLAKSVVDQAAGAGS